MDRRDDGMTEEEVEATPHDQQPVGSLGSPSQTVRNSLGLARQLRDGGQPVQDPQAALGASAEERTAVATRSPFQEQLDVVHSLAYCLDSLLALRETHSNADDQSVELYF